MSEQQFQFVIRKGPQVGQVFRLDANALIIGRDPMSDIVINDPEISRQHARLSKRDNSYEIEDLGSTNGTFVNGQRLGSEPYRLEPGQTVNMGSGVRLIYEAVGTTGADVDTLMETAAEWSPMPPAAPDLLDTDPPHRRRAVDPPSEHDFAPPNRAPEPYAYDPPAASIPLVPTGEGNNNNRRNVTIAVVAILLLCCCCAFLGFMYQWGGDWLLDYLGLLP